MINYKLRKNRRAKHLRLRVYGDGRVVMTVPPWIGATMIEKFLAEKSGWIRAKLDLFKTVPPQSMRRRSRRDYLKQKDEALALVLNRVRHYNAVYNFPLNRITIRNQKTRWGSCSSKKNMSINYQIVSLPQRLQDYLVVHELCHLKEMNHSPRFWALVEQTIPDYRTVRQELRRFAIV